MPGLIHVAERLAAIALLLARREVVTEQMIASTIREIHHASLDAEHIARLARPEHPGDQPASADQED